MNDSYKGVAKFYDLFAKSDDLEFFVKLAFECGGRALELGVGTARVAVELARSGISVTGIDTSRDMLEVARRKMKREPEEVRQRLTLKRADMRSFHLDQVFDLIYSPGGGFQECLTEKDMRACLDCVSSHLKREGKLVLAIWMPSLERNFGERIYDEPQPDHQGHRVARSIVWSEPGKEGRPRIEILYQILADGLLLEEYEVTATVNVLSPEKVRSILKGSGFLIEHEFGNFESTQYVPGDEWMVVVAKQGV